MDKNLKTVFTRVFIGCLNIQDPSDLNSSLPITTIYSIASTVARVVLTYSHHLAANMTRPHQALAFRAAAPLSAPTASPARLCNRRRSPSATLAPHDDATVEVHAPPRAPLSSQPTADAAAAERWARITTRAGDTTLAVHGGERVRSSKHKAAIMDAIQTPIVQSSTFTFRSTADCINYNRGGYESFEYSRYGNPTTRAAEEKLCALERAEDALLSASGMNAVTTMLLALVPPNGHVVLTTDCYRRTRQFARTMLPSMGIRTTVIDPADLDALRDAVRAPGGADLFFSESPTNPLIRVVDTPSIARICRDHGVITVIDTTFATPINYRPITDGADLVLHSGTKYLAGHHDVLCGAIAGRADLVAKVRSLHGVLGGVVDPHAAFLINRGMKTLAMRMIAHNHNAETLARFLDAHPKVANVRYPTLPSHPDYAVAQSLFKGFGGVFSFDIRGDGNPWSQHTFDATGRFVDALTIPYIGPSMGGCESLVEQVCIMGYFDQPLKERKRLGITNGIVRFSAGIEDVHDLVDDVTQALEYA